MRSSAQQLRNESGFTLVELLVTTAILVILCGIAFTGFSVYRAQAYERSSEQMMQQARTALEAGKQDSESFPAELMTVDQNSSGPLLDPTAQMLMPGLVLPEHFRVYATHDPTCTDAACMEDYIITRPCSIAKKVVYFRTFGGIEATTYDVDDAGPCT